VRGRGSGARHCGLEPEEERWWNLLGNEGNEPNMAHIHHSYGGYGGCVAATKGCKGEIEGLDGLMKWLVFAAAGGGKMAGDGWGFGGTRRNTSLGSHTPKDRRRCGRGGRWRQCGEVRNV
jgi:hypothetical protein